MVKPGSADKSTAWDGSDVGVNAVFGTAVSARWSHSPSSTGTGRSAGNVVSGNRIQLSVQHNVDCTQGTSGAALTGHI